jgi:hypothetical protein
MLICEKRHKTINTIARPTAKFLLYIKASTINANKIKFPKPVSNKLTNKLGTANITTQSTTNKVINPTAKLRFFLEKTSEIEKLIITYVYKKVKTNQFKKNAFNIVRYV